MPRSFALGLGSLVFAWAMIGANALADETAPDSSPARELSPAAKAADEASRETYELYKVFVDTVDQVERNYVQKITRRELMEAAIRGVLTKLDQHSSYISPDDLSKFKTSVDNRFGGIGIQIEMDDAGTLRVLSPLVGTPAYRAGLQAGDRILEIDGESTEGIHTLDDVVNKLKGEPGTSVTVTILHPNAEEPKQITLEREVIQIETVMGDRRTGDDDHWDFMLDPENKLGYIRLTAFSRETFEELEKAVKKLKEDGLKGLILDLRFNPGGLLTSAIEVSDLFISKGRIVSTEGRNSEPRAWDAQEEGTYDGFPMAVLVNRYSASASEIVSACLQDHERAIVVGERTYGKGSVQNVIELENGKSALKLTTASYQRPNGKNIHRFPEATEEDEWGVHPSEGYEVRLSPTEMRRLVEYRRKRDIVPTHGAEPAADKPEAPAAPPAEENASAEPKPEKPEQPLPEDHPEVASETSEDEGEEQGNFTDRQLDKALEYLRLQVSQTAQAG
jgi:carboxyl-terminal processing protease